MPLFSFENVFDSPGLLCNSARVCSKEESRSDLLGNVRSEGVDSLTG